MSSSLTSRWGRFAYPTKVALVYAVFSVAWILVSDQLIAYLAPDRDALAAISSAKGFLYVAITGAGLFLLLTVRPHETFPGEAGDHAPAPRLFLILFIAITTLALTLGTLLFRHFAAKQKEEVSLQINSVVELKAALIARWLEENSRQAQMLMQSELLASHLRDWITTSSQANRIRIEQRLATLRTIMDADSILLTDITGIVRASKGERIAPAEVLKRHVRHVVSKNESAVLPLYAARATGGELDIHMVVPLLTNVSDKSTVVGAAIVSREARRFLDSVTNNRPVPGWTGESLLVLRQQGQIVILSATRLAAGTDTEVVVPVAMSDVAEIQLAQNPGSTVEGLSYRKIPILAASRAIEGTDWILISQIPQQQVYGDIRHIGILVSAVTVSAIIVFAALLAMLWRQQRGRYQLQVAESEQKSAALLRHYAQLADNINDIVVLLDDRDCIVDVNDRAITAYGYTRSELIGQPFDRLTTDDTTGTSAVTTPGAVADTLHMRRDGSKFPVDASVRVISEGGHTFRQIVLRDISAERTSEQRFRSYVENAPLAVIVVDRNGNIVDANPAAGALVGASREDLVGRPIAGIHVAEGPGDLLLDTYSLQEHGHFEAERCLRHTSGRTLWALLKAVLLPDGYTLAFIQDISRRVEAEEALRESESKFRSLVEQSISGIYIIQNGIVVYANPRAADIVGREPAALVGAHVLPLIAEEDRATVAQAMSDMESGKITVLPLNVSMLRADGTAVDVGTHSSLASYGGRPAIIGVMQDITERQRARDREQQYLHQLERSMLGTIDSVSRMVDLRDPYTSGHEHRVGEIAAAIGAEMGLDDRTQRGLRIIGYVHDIGKIAIPAEILSKPTRLTKAEFEMIKTHAQAGYDILSDVEFAWPVAEAIRQHHERMDGSGYPRGLKGTDIVMEARIIAVADTIEAMSSHRPYRPGKGLDTAMQEIELHRDVLYDPRVVDAALRLFRVSGYQIPE